MKEFKFIKITPAGKVYGMVRIIGKFIFFKYNKKGDIDKIIDKFKKKGLDIEIGKGWVKVDLIQDNESVKLRNIIIDVKTDNNNEIENKLFQFYYYEYKSQGFYVKETQNEDDI